jgi:hypothetical protein
MHVDLIDVLSWQAWAECRFLLWILLEAFLWKLSILSSIEKIDPIWSKTLTITVRTSYSGLLF